MSAKRELKKSTAPASTASTRGEYQPPTGSSERVHSPLGTSILWVIGERRGAPEEKKTTRLPRSGSNRDSSKLQFRPVSLLTPTSLKKTGMRIRATEKPQNCSLPWESLR